MECRGFIVEPLPYSYSALEPYIIEQIMRVHHDELYRGYVEKLNNVLDKYPEYCNFTLEALILYVNDLPENIAMKVFNYAGGVYNHQLYFDTMNPAPNEVPKGNLMSSINSKYGSFDFFKEAFKKKALEVFGSGYTWLAVNNKGELDIISTANQTTVLSFNMFPLIGIDLWEHAYFCQYLGDRGSYIDSWFEVADWQKAEERYR